MATDERKKKIESLRESISRLETQQTLAAGNKKQQESIQRVIDSFKEMIRKIKSLD